MQHLMLQIPDNKMDFFMELVNSLGFVKVNKKTSNILSPEQIETIEETRNKIKENPDSLIDWETAENQIDWDAC
ncbi:hypothetical protein F0919_09115 [Taibaiella lutea]|uniref:Addiction module component n=1 Tax=Taibaiella lutea TaxID=2608001 RepID=A0A5M6CHR5_9BACT|nr:hypothetical protein [Taibaiella lutea]KAA5534758.1 hypothetical protein F0919_09115 [Taibaiella lutea]